MEEFSKLKGKMREPEYDSLESFIVNNTNFSTDQKEKLAEIIENIVDNAKCCSEN